MAPTFLNRNVNEGFSGGEKKRNEILQLAVLEVGLDQPLTGIDPRLVPGVCCRPIDEGPC
jgi:Fe-S cluster assembly ATP-binding protein